MIPVTKPFLPPKEIVTNLLEEIWERNWLTNNGPLLNQFELSLKKYLNQDHLLVLNNGTTALQFAIKALGLKGEIITTPFSYVATTSSIVWEGCTPVFADIDNETFNLDPSKIEETISKRTSAILATHVFGNPCDIENIELLARKYNLKVIYDASHCFGSKFQDKSIFEFGDISTLSLHATKLVHSVEGGVVFTKDSELLKKIAYLRNFGHDGPYEFNGIGINGKNSELHAAVGIAILKYADEILRNRKKIYNYYSHLLVNEEIQTQKIHDNLVSNFSYYPVLFKTEEITLKVLGVLNKNEIFPRRYFYPLLSDLNYVKSGDFPIARSVSNRILCLPSYYGLSESEQDLISRLILRTLRY